MRTFRGCTQYGFWPFLMLALCSLRAHAAESDLDRSLAAEVQLFVQSDAANLPSQCQVEFVGSSTILKWKDALAMDMAPIPVINRGFGGSQIEHVNRWFDQLVRPYHPSAIVFYAGDNDIDAGKSVDRVLADFDAFMALKTESLGDTPVYFVSIKPSKLRASQFPLQSRVNEAIRQRSAQRADLLFIDVVAPMLENGSPKDIFEPDGLHMTRAGYTIWAQVIRKALSRSYDSDARACQLRAASQSNAQQLAPAKGSAWDPPLPEWSPRQIDADGSIHVPAFVLPESSLLSEDTLSALKAARERDRQDDAAVQKVCPDARTADLTAMPTIRQCQAKAFYETSLYKDLRERYPVVVTVETIGKVYTEVFTPQDGVAAENRNRVLINVHGSHFESASRVSSHLESIPISVVGKIKVVSIDYRMAPEYTFPAASEDVAAVYRELLKSYRPQNIGIYGSSAGGLLTAESVAWFDKQGLPLPGAVGMFAGAATYYQDGDSGHISTSVGGAPYEPSPVHPYFKRTGVSNSLAFPSTSAQLMAKFPPSLLLASTRDIALSSVVHTHAQLVKLGVEAELHVWDGLGHVFYYDPTLPESREVYDIIPHFFAAHLGRPHRAQSGASASRDRLRLQQ